MSNRPPNGDAPIWPNDGRPAEYWDETREYASLYPPTNAGPPPPLISPPAPDNLYNAPYSPAPKRGGFGVRLGVLLLIVAIVGGGFFAFTQRHHLPTLAAQATATVLPSPTPLPPFAPQLLYNNVGTSDDGMPSAANFDGIGGDSYSAQALEKVGIKPGGTVNYNGIPFIWPIAPAGGANNMGVQGQTLLVNAARPYTTLGFLGASHFGGDKGTLTLTYTDGTIQKADLGLSDWVLPFGGTIQFGNAKAFTLPHYNNGQGIVKKNCFLFYADIALKPDKTLQRIDFPLILAFGQMHIFTIGAK